jgi:hypothetical protein
VLLSKRIPTTYRRCTTSTRLSSFRLLFWLICFVLSLIAQTPTGKIFGPVFPREPWFPSPNHDHKQEYRCRASPGSTAAGTYTAALGAGQYEVRVESPGFGIPIHRSGWSSNRSSNASSKSEEVRFHSNAGPCHRCAQGRRSPDEPSSLGEASCYLPFFSRCPFCWVRISTSLSVCSLEAFRTR